MTHTWVSTGVTGKGEDGPTEPEVDKCNGLGRLRIFRV